MTAHPLILADSGFLFAYYNSGKDKDHQQVRGFSETSSIDASDYTQLHYRSEK